MESSEAVEDAEHNSVIQDQSNPSDDIQNTGQSETTSSTGNADDNQTMTSNFMENWKSRTNVLRNHFKSLNRNNLRKSKKVKELQKELALLKAQVQLEQQGFYVFETDPVNGVLKVIRTDFFDEDQEPILNTE